MYEISMLIHVEVIADFVFSLAVILNFNLDYGKIKFIDYKDSL